MKTQFRTWKNPALRSCAVCATTWMFSLSICSAAAEAKVTEADKPKEDEKSEKSEADYRNWFETSVGATFVDGDKSAFQQRRNLPRGAFGGVQDFHYEQDVGKKGLFQV